MAEKYYSISPYAYVGNNPLRRIDPNGKDWRDLYYGIIDGVYNNFTIGATDALGVNHQNEVNNASHYNTGRTVADLIGIVGGIIEIGAGGSAVVGGSASTVVSGGTASPVSVPLAAGGAITVTHGGGVIGKALQKEGRISEMGRKSSGNGSKKGGGKNSPHANQDARNNALNKYNEEKSKLDDMIATPNKTPELKKEITKQQKLVKQLQEKKDFTGEEHSRNAKGSR